MSQTTSPRKPVGLPDKGIPPKRKMAKASLVRPQLTSTKVESVEEVPSPWLTAWRERQRREVVERNQDEKQRDLEEYFLPHLHALYRGRKDADALGFLGFLFSQVKAKCGAPYDAGSRQGKLVQEMLGPWRRSVWDGAELLDWQWEKLIEICVELHGRVVPHFYVHPPRPKTVPKGLMLVRTTRLAKDSAWEIAQKLTFLVGGKRFADYELMFIFDHWKKAWELGPEAFRFRWDGQRWAAERLFVEACSRPTERCWDQVARFKVLAKLYFVPVWRVKPTQLVLPTLMGVVQPHKAEEAEPKSYRAPADLHLDLLAVLFRRWDGTAEQLSFVNFLPAELSQQDLFK